jgi:4-aminobutyrate aminotransferase-like enzyme
MPQVELQNQARARLIAEQREYLFPSVGTYYREPLVLEAGHGSWVRDADGREYLDFYGGVLTTSLGHCQPDVVRAVQEQVATLGHTSTLYVTAPQVEAARRLATITPGHGRLKRTFFTNSGTEAVETAVMLARVYTGRTEIVTLRHGYAGRTALGTELTAQSVWRPLPGLATGVRFAASPYHYRSRCGLPFAESADAFAAELEDVIATTTTGQPAAFLAEPIQGVGGIILPPPGYFEKAVEIIHRYGGVFIADEVQSGMGRTGRWFAIEHWGVEPDIMTLGKGVAGGYPVGATVATDEIAASFKARQFSTFGGNPVCMAAMCATLDVMVREDVPARAIVRGAQLRVGLDALAREHAWIGEVRGLGLMQALELVKDRESRTPDAARAQAVLEGARTEGLLLGAAGLWGNVVRLGPNLLVTEAEVSEALARLGRACARAA